MFLPPLNLLFNPWFCLAPFFDCDFEFFISPLLLNFLVLILEPLPFNALFFHVNSWHVVQVVWLSFEAILAFEYHWLIASVELLKWIGMNWLIFILHNWVSLRGQVAHTLSNTTHWAVFLVLLKQFAERFLFIGLNPGLSRRDVFMKCPLFIVKHLSVFHNYQALIQQIESLLLSRLFLSLYCFFNL